MAKNVKITTKISVMDLLCPHYCRNCGRLGEVLCGCCKKHILEGRKNRCPNCGVVVWKRCKKCNLPLDATFMVGWREGVLERIVEDYKYQSVRALGGVLAELADAAMPELKGEVVVVPLPTMAPHVRQRGLDHTLIVARKLARRRGWKCERCLARAKNTVQVGAAAAERVQQAREAYKMRPGAKLCPDATYLLYDDVWTTGASMRAAVELMRKNGAKKVMAVVLAGSK